MTSASRVVVLTGLVLMCLPAHAQDWATNFGAGSMAIEATAIDTAGNLYVGGSFTTAFTLGSTTLSKIGSTDSFVAKFSPSGAPVWVKNQGGAGGNARTLAIAVDGSGNVYAAGYFNTGNLTTPAITLVGGSLDAFLIKLDTNGDPVWARAMGGTSASMTPTGLKVDATGNTFMAGFFSSADLTTPAKTKLGSQDAFFIKRDANADIVWATSAGGAGASIALGQLVLDEGGNVLVAGHLSGASLTSPALTKVGNADGVIFKANGSTGAVTSVVSFGNAGATVSVGGIGRDAIGNLYWGGQLGGGNLVTPAVTRLGTNDALVVKVSAAGAIVWAKNVGAATANLTQPMFGTDAQGNSFWFGQWAGSTTLPSLGLNRLGDGDGLLLRLSPNSQVLSATAFGGFGASVPSNNYGGPGAIPVDALGRAYLGTNFTGGNLSTPPATLLGSITGLAMRVSPPVVVVSATPNRGPVDGGTSVTLAGAGFVSGAAVTFGGAAASQVMVSSATSLQATAPPGLAGARDITVTIPDGGTGTLLSGFTYVSPPTVSSITPTSGFAAGGTAVTITGSDFQTGATVSIGGTPATNVAFVSATSLTATTPAHAAGAADVTVINPDGQTGTLAAAFTFVAAPTLTSVAPAAGPLAGGTTLTLTGTGFVTGASVTVGGAAATDVNVLSATSATAKTPAAVAGTVAVTLTNPDTQSATLGSSYTYAAAPTLTAVSPPQGPAAGTTALTLTGTGFVSGASVTVGGAAATDVVVSSASSLTAKAPAGSVGLRDVVVTNPDGQSGTLSNAYRYLGSFTVGGTVSGLGASSSLSLQNNGGDDVSVNADGEFTFSTSLLDGASYEVTIATQPTGRTCTIANASGTIAGANVSNVEVSCPAPVSTGCGCQADPTSALGVLAFALSLRTLRRRSRSLHW